MAMTSHYFIHIFLIFFIPFTVSEPKSYIGCFIEQPGKRLMNDAERDFRGALRIDDCVSFCRSQNFGFAGVEVGYECFCSNERPLFKALGNQVSDCNTPCEGDYSTMCGGKWRVSAYELRDNGVNYVAQLYMGCHTDSNEKVLGTDVGYTSGTLTPEICLGHCFRLGYLYSGLEAGSKCICGDNIKGPGVSEGLCDIDCVGNNRFKCGGGRGRSIYRTSIPNEDDAGHELGCFVDSEKARILSDYHVNLPGTNSPRRCMNVCRALGYKFSGVQFGFECYCGNNHPIGNWANDCNFECPGDRSPRCGASWRINVFSTGRVMIYPCCIFCQFFFPSKIGCDLDKTVS